MTVSTERDNTYEFDLVVGFDGAGSIVRRALFPEVKPTPPTNNSAYRAIVPNKEIRDDTQTRLSLEMKERT